MFYREYNRTILQKKGMQFYRTRTNENEKYQIKGILMGSIGMRGVYPARARELRALGLFNW